MYSDSLTGLDFKLVLPVLVRAVALIGFLMKPCVFMYASLQVVFPPKAFLGSLLIKLVSLCWLSRERKTHTH